MFVTDAIAVCVVDANPVAIQELVGWVRTVRRGAQRRAWIVRARRWIGASRAAVQITECDVEVIRRWVEVACEWQQTSCDQTASVVVGGVGVVRWVRWVRATRNLELVANAIAVCVVDADPVAVVAVIREFTAAIVQGGLFVVVARVSGDTPSA